jgi:class 3 adenylate cyclase/tetratricopeptide (TPR) repeat protein
VFFADVANYTAMSEKLDPEEVHQIMDGCFKILIDEIHKYEGTINQFTGDGIMALFGAPVSHEDHAQRACYAALSVQKAMEEYGQKIKKDIGVDFKMRIGLNSGHVIVGSIGDDLRMDYSAVGDTTNLASRMENAAEPESVLVSENTHKIVRSYFEFEPIGEIEVKGKEKPQEAYKLIKTGDVETRIGASIAKGLTRFVGRPNSMPALMEVWEKAKSGSGQVVGIVGEAGVGKSRILLEFRNRRPQGEFTYLEGQCLQYGENIIYGPIKDIVKTYFDIEEGDREFIIKKKVIEKTFSLDEAFSESALPVFQDFLSLKVDDQAYVQLEPQQKRERTFETIRDLFIRISQIKPLIIAVEDLHWIDRTSEEFLDYLIEWIAKTPIMLTLLYRTEYRHQWGSKTYYNRIGLDHLGTASSTELVRAMLEEGEVAPELKELILERSAGNPLFMEEFTQTLLENGSIEKRDKQYVLSRKVSDIQVPDTIQGIIAARMDRLEENLKRTMQVASVIGRDFAFRILQAITNMREELKSYLLNLQGLGFIYEKSLFPELEYIFKHALTQEVAYNSLLLKRRKEIHEQIGGAIEELYANRLEELYEMLAYHYSESENHEKAYQYLRLSGDKAARNYANWEAVGFYKEAIDILKTEPKTEENIGKLIEFDLLIAGLLIPLSHPDELLNYIQEGEKLAQEIGDTKSLLIFYNYQSAFYSWKENPALALKYAENTFREAEKIQDVEMIVQSAFALINVCQITGHFLKIVEIAPKVIDLLEKNRMAQDIFIPPIHAYSFMCVYYGISLAQLGNYEEGHKYCEKGLYAARELGETFNLGYMELMNGGFYTIRGDGKGAINHLSKSIDYLQEASFAIALGAAWCFLGYSYYLIGDLNAARKNITKGIEIHEESGAEGILYIYYNHLSLIHCELGEFEKAEGFAEKAVELSKKNKSNSGEGSSRISLGMILGRKDLSQVKTAEGSIYEGIKILDKLKLRPFCNIGYLYLGELYIDTRQKEMAGENLKKAEAAFKDMGMDYWLARTYSAYAGLYKKEGDYLGTKENLNKAIEILKECGADGWVNKYEKELATLS